MPDTRPPSAWPTKRFVPPGPGISLCGRGASCGLADAADFPPYKKDKALSRALYVPHAHARGLSFPPADTTTYPGTYRRTIQVTTMLSCNAHAITMVTLIHE